MKAWIFSLLITAAVAAPAGIPDKSIAQSLLGWPLTASARIQLAEALKANPACDLLYHPLLKVRDAQAFKDYFQKAGTDGWVLLYLLRERETYQQELAAAHMDPMKLLERLLWANKLPAKEGGCPWPGPTPKVAFEGYTDEITDDCFTFTLTFRLDGEPSQLSIPWCDPFEKDSMLEEATRLFKSAGVPLLHRNIIQRRSADELKLPTGPKTPPPESKQKQR